MNKKSSYIAPRLGGISERIAKKIRKEIFFKVIGFLKPKESHKVLDIGATSDISIDSNFFEEYYPFKNQITVIGKEDASFLEKKYPGLKFIYGDACELPFDDDYFDLAFCSAVIEHVGNRNFQLKLITEGTRVAKNLVITTPNRYFPLEFHTLTPFLHWLPQRFFRFYLKITFRKFFSKEDNLNLLTSFDLEKMFSSKSLEFKNIDQKLFGFKSNLVYIVSKNKINF